MTRKAKTNPSYAGKTKATKVPSYAEEAITRTVYENFQTAYDHFAAKLFADNRLPTKFILTMARHSHSGGHFAPDRYTARGGTDRIPEINLNPDAFVGQPDRWILSVLVHEMTHLWQHIHGKYSPGGYHNAQWAARMKRIGLYPSNTGAVGGKETGKQMRHYILDRGPFSAAYDELAATGFKLRWQSTATEGDERKKTESKTKFTCPLCSANAWGKPDLEISCTPCGAAMTSAAASVSSYDAVAA